MLVKCMHCGEEFIYPRYGRQIITSKAKYVCDECNKKLNSEMEKKIQKDLRKRYKQK